jgi:sporadic carbohydrate cluster protein (TIGR04323 family)
VKRLRGYVTSRPFFDNRVPQHVQNIVIRDYCQRRGFEYLLSATEYAMPACYMMLEDALNELGQIDGLAMYSIFLLPRRQSRRLEIYRKVLAQGASLHGAVENFAMQTEADIRRVEDIWTVQDLVASSRPAAALRERDAAPALNQQPLPGLPSGK